MAGQRTPLHSWHAAHGARFIDYFGWDVAESYGNPEAEYSSLRNAAGFIDVCHTSRLRIEAADAVGFLNDLLTVSVGAIPLEMNGFGFMCNDRGGIIDAFTIYRDEKYSLLLGATAARQESLDWIRGHAARHAKFGATVADVSLAQGQISVRGPSASQLIERLSYGQRLRLEPGMGAIATIGTARCLVLNHCRGPLPRYEIIAGSMYIPSLWEKIAEMAEGFAARPVGMVARDMLRIETGVASIGTDIDSDTTPLELNQAESVDFTKRHFIGRRALMHSTVSEFSRTLVTIRIDNKSAIDPGSEILFDDTPVGRVTSVTISPTQRCRVALGFINTMKAVAGVRVALRGSDGQLHVGEIQRKSSGAQITPA